MFSYFDYSVGVRKASLLFMTACQLPALLPSCWCNAMYHSHFSCSIRYAVILKKKAKPNQNTMSNHHHIYHLVCITSCSNCIRFHWVIFNHFPSKAYKEFSSVGSFQPGSLLPLQDACVIQMLQSGRCSETSCAVQVSKNFLTHLLKVLPPFLPPFKFLMLPCYLPLEFCCWGL